MSTMSKVCIILLSIFILNCNCEARANIFTSASKAVSKIFTKASKSKTAPVLGGVAASRAMKKQDKEKKEKK